MPDPNPAPATQSVVVQPSAPAPQLSANVGVIGEWAGSVVAIVALLTLLYKALTRDVGRDVIDVKQKLGTVAARVDALEHLRTGDLERIVRLEAAITSIEKGFDRIEKRLADEFGQLALSIREIRVVGVRGERP